jgi:hypothetical protein
MAVASPAMGVTALCSPRRNRAPGAISKAQRLTARMRQHRCNASHCGERAGMQGLRKLLRALAIVVLPLVAALIFSRASSGTEMVVGALLILFALGLIATWFWQPH